MPTMRKMAYATAAIIGAAALTATLNTSARANSRVYSWDYGYGTGHNAPAAHGAAVQDLLSSYYGCIDLASVSDKIQPDGTFFAVEKGFCAG